MNVKISEDWKTQRLGACFINAWCKHNQWAFPSIILPPVNSVKKLNLNWVSKTQFIIRIFLFFITIYLTQKKTYKKIKSSPNKKDDCKLK